MRDRLTGRSSCARAGGPAECCGVEFSDLVWPGEDPEGLPPGPSPSTSRGSADVPSTVEGEIVAVAVYLVARFLPER